MIGSGFYGIVRSNIAREELWRRENFGTAFAVALSNYIRDIGIPANYVRTGTDLVCGVSEIPMYEVYSCRGSSDLTFGFGETLDRYSGYADGVPPMDLVLSCDGEQRVAFDIKSSVVPDSSTKGLEPDMMGPEITIRSPTLMYCALSMAEACSDRADDARGILGPACSAVTDWSDGHAVAGRMDSILEALDAFEREFNDRQRPLVIQAIWRTEGASPIMAEDALDVFVWSDHALSRLFLDSVRRNRDGTMTRPMRSAARLARTIYDISMGNRPDLGAMFEEMSYGMPGERELMVNGRTVNRYIGCPRLVRPEVGSDEVRAVLSPGTEDLIVPERRLDQSVYYAMTAHRG